MEAKLNPCGCGGEAESFVTGDDKRFLRCAQCGVCTEKTDDSYEHHVRIWNTAHPYRADLQTQESDPARFYNDVDVPECVAPPAIGNVEHFGTDTKIPEPIPSVVSFTAPQPRDVEQEAREMWEQCASAALGGMLAYPNCIGEAISIAQSVGRFADAALAEWRERWGEKQNEM